MSQKLHIQGYEAPVGADILEITNQLNVLAGALRVFEPDGHCYCEPTGTINYYIQESGWPVPLEAALKRLDDLGLTVGEPRLETSRMTAGPVYRIPVLDNPTSRIEKAPSLIVAEGNARILRTLLDFEQEIGVDEALEKLSRIGSAAIARLQRSPMTLGPVHYYGVSFDQIQRYLDSAERIARWAQSKGYAILYFA